MGGVTEDRRSTGSCSSQRDRNSSASDLADGGKHDWKGCLLLPGDPGRRGKRRKMARDEGFTVIRIWLMITRTEPMAHQAAQTLLCHYHETETPVENNSMVRTIVYTVVSYQ